MRNGKIIGDEMDRIEFGQKIAEKRILEDESQAKFGKRFGVSQQAVYGWETGTTLPAHDTLKELCLFIGVDLDDAIRLRTRRGISAATVAPPPPTGVRLKNVKLVHFENGIPEAPKSQVDLDRYSHPAFNKSSSNIAPGPPITRRVPLISNVQAGAWTEVVDNLQPGDAEEWIDITSKVGPNSFALRVVGNSMENEFWEGELVIIDPARESMSGDYVVAKINHDEATFKQLIKDGGNIYLRPLNSAYPVIAVPPEKEFRIIGRVVEKVKRY